MQSKYSLTRANFSARISSMTHLYKVWSSPVQSKSPANVGLFALQLWFSLNHTGATLHIQNAHVSSCYHFLPIRKRNCFSKDVNELLILTLLSLPWSEAMSTDSPFARVSHFTVCSGPFDSSRSVKWVLNFFPAKYFQHARTKQNAFTAS